VTFIKKLKQAAAEDQHLDWANLSFYWEKNEQLLSHPGSEWRVVFMGDSITEEWSRLHPEFFNNQSYINRGIGGQTTPQMLVRFRQDVIDLNPDVVAILAGTNDIAGNTGPSNVEMITNNIFSMAEIAMNSNIAIIISSILPVYTYPWANHIKNVPETILKINQRLKEFSLENNITYLDYYSSMVGEKRELKHEYTTDGVHLNKEGYELMSSLVYEILKK